MSRYDWYDELSDEVLFGPPPRPLVPRGWKPGDKLPEPDDKAGEWRQMTEEEEREHRLLEGNF